MPANQEMIDRMLAMEPAERVAVAGLLWHSVEIPDLFQPPPNEAWLAELERRRQSYRDGTAKTYSWDEVKSHVEQHLRDLKS